METMNWVKVTEGLPNIGQQVLICHTDGTIYLGELTNNGAVWMGDGFMIPVKNTSHWMPIVKPTL